MDKLQRAAEYIKSGQKKEGGELLIELLREEPHNEQAWLWLSAAVKGREKKEECLERVLTLNPENAQARKLLTKLESQQPDPPPEEPIPSPFGDPEQEEPAAFEKEAEAQPEEQISPFTAAPDPGELPKAASPLEREEPQPEAHQPEAHQPEAHQPEAHQPEAHQPEAHQPEAHQPEAHQPDAYQPPTYINQPEEDGPGETGEEETFQTGAREEHTFGELVQAWTRFFKMSEDFFKQEQKYASGGDTLLSVLVHTIATVLIVLITGFIQFRAVSTALQAQLPSTSQVPDLGSLFVGLLVGAVFLTPISFYLNAGLQFLGSRLFGGEGSYIEQAYLQALIQVPATVLGGLLSLGAIFPAAACILGPLGLVLGIWTLILNVRAIKAVHELGTGSAVAAIIVPPILLTFVFGCILFATGSVIGTIFEQVINQGMNLP